eukprot:3411523-Pyramimonas_sp.AAC.1
MLGHAQSCFTPLPHRPKGGHAKIPRVQQGRKRRCLTWPSLQPKRGHAKSPGPCKFEGAWEAQPVAAPWTKASSSSVAP